MPQSAVCNSVSPYSLSIDRHVLVAHRKRGVADEANVGSRVHLDRHAHAADASVVASDLDAARPERRTLRELALHSHHIEAIVRHERDPFDQMRTLPPRPQMNPQKI